MKKMMIIKVAIEMLILISILISFFIYIIFGDVLIQPVFLNMDDKGVLPAVDMSEIYTMTIKDLVGRSLRISPIIQISLVLTLLICQAVSLYFSIKLFRRQGILK